MKTFEIKKENLGEPICEGYKVIKWDGTTIGDSSFCYAEEGEELVGRVFSVDGEINVCRWGLHFSKKPRDVFGFYEPFGFNRYFKVRAYGKTVDAKEGDKTVAQTIEFVEEYDFMQFIDIINHYTGTNSSDNNSNGNYCSNGNSHSYSNSYSYGNNSSSGNIYSSGNNYSDGNSHSNGNSYSYGNHYSHGNYYSDGNYNSHGNNCSDGNNCGCGNNHSSGNSHSFGNNDSDGNDHSSGISKCFGLKNCNGAYNSAFCLDKNGISNEIFNKKVDEERAKDIIKKLKSFNYYPKWLNIEECKGNKGWMSFNWTKLKGATPKRAWADMPESMLNYIKSLPEYDKKIFKKITEGDNNDQW